MELNCSTEEFSIFDQEDDVEEVDEPPGENCANGSTAKKEASTKGNSINFLTNCVNGGKRAGEAKSVHLNHNNSTVINLVHHVAVSTTTATTAASTSALHMDSSPDGGACASFSSQDIVRDDSNEFLEDEEENGVHFQNSIHTLYFNENGQCSSAKDEGKFCCSNCEQMALHISDSSHNKMCSAADKVFAVQINGHGENKVNEFAHSSTFEPNVPTCNALSPELDFLDFDLEEQNLSDDEIKSENSSDSRAHTPQLLETASGGCSTGNVKNDLGGSSSSSPFVRNCFVHSLSYQNVVSSPKYHNNCLRPSALSNFELRNLDDLFNDNADSDYANLEACGQRLLRRESSLFSIPTEDMDYEEYNVQSALLCSYNAAKVMTEKRANCDADEFATFLEGNKFVSTSKTSDEVPLEKTMIWSEMEACTRQVTQIGTSACGPTAVINVMMALNVSYDKSNIENYIHTRFRAETSPVAHYLISRSTAGTTHEDLITGISKLTDGSVVGRFFHMYPVREFHLLPWLGSWIAKGAVPIATLNLQRGICVGQSIPDAWHHQMVFGVGPKGVYLTNPLECVSAVQIEQQLSSDSVLLIRRNDILCRWDKECDLSPLVTQDQQWRDRNVIGQVVNMLREATSSWVPGQRRHLTSHVKIPAAYKSGITLFVRRETSVYDDLIACPELPIASSCTPETNTSS